MITTTWTDALAGMPAAGLVVRPRRDEVDVPAGYGPARCPRTSGRAPEAFTAPFQGTGLPFGASVVDIVAPVQRRTPTDNVHIGTTLGLHSSSRPPG